MSFTSNLNWRYATKKFDTAKPVSEEHLNLILEAARMAPTSFGLQPFHITVVRDAAVRTKLRGAAWDQAQITDSSALLVFSARSDGESRVQSYLDLASGGNPEARAALSGYGDMMTNSMRAKAAVSESGLGHQDSNSQMVSWAARQAYIALGFALAACAELEIDSAPMEGFDSAAFKDILGLGEVMTPVVLLGVGYRDPSDTIRPKVRFPESDIVDRR